MTASSVAAVLIVVGDEGSRRLVTRLVDSEPGFRVSIASANASSARDVLIGTAHESANLPTVLLLEWAANDADRRANRDLVAACPSASPFFWTARQFRELADPDAWPSANAGALGRMDRLGILAALRESRRRSGIDMRGPAVAFD